MFMPEIMLAMLVAVLLTVLFVAVLGWRAPFRGQDSWGMAVALFFMIVFLGTWAVGSWIRPTGPTLWGVSWLVFLVSGLIIATLLAALAPPRMRSHRQPASALVAADAAHADETANAVAAGLGVFVWLLMVLLLLVIVSAYLL